MLRRLVRYIFFIPLPALLFAFYELPVNSGASCFPRLLITSCGGSVLDPRPKRPVPYTYLRQADVAMEKRIWRVIDLREKINEPLMYPLEPTQCRIAFIDLVKRGIKKGALTAFEDDEFLREFSSDEALKRLVVNVPLVIEDSAGNPLETKIITDTVSNLQINHVRLKEDWFFDKQRSVMDVRIIGIAFEWYDERKGLYLPTFWLYFPQCRNWFVNFNVYNPKNDAEQRNYDEYFMKRMFNSYIEKESNTFDRYISTYAKGIDLLLESERIKNEMFKWEQDLWHF